MRIASLLTACIAICPFLGGCVDVDTTVHVRIDGSGRVEERVLVASRMVEMLRSMGRLLGGEEGEGVPGLIDREKLAAQAGSMGHGVALESVEAVVSDAGEGYRAVFSFRDINTLRLDQNPGDRAPTPGEVEPSAEEVVTFEFRPGATAELVVRSPPVVAQEGASCCGDGDGAESPEASGTGLADAAGEAGLAMMKQMFDGFRVAMSIEVEGEIVETNATYRSGSEVTLLDLDFGKLLENLERLEALSGADPRSINEAKRLLRGVPGIVVELSPEITIRFSSTQQYLALAAGR